MIAILCRAWQCEGRQCPPITSRCSYSVWLASVVSLRVIFNRPTGKIIYAFCSPQTVLTQIRRKFVTVRQRRLAVESEIALDRLGLERKSSEKLFKKQSLTETTFRSANWSYARLCLLSGVSHNSECFQRFCLVDRVDLCAVLFYLFLQKSEYLCIKIFFLFRQFQSAFNSAQQNVKEHAW
jgi:hypothetical protein